MAISNILINKLPSDQYIQICVDLNEIATMDTINMAHFLDKYLKRILTTIDLIAAKETTLDNRMNRVPINQIKYSICILTIPV